MDSKSNLGAVRVGGEVVDAGSLAQSTGKRKDG